ncbi:MAG TPA: DUF481 domain-containing protein, partial [Polyangiaceae bacterium]|nr:DUF481 domain-containing protein [Polyangiaceae bacterium]
MRLEGLRKTGIALAIVTGGLVSAAGARAQVNTETLRKRIKAVGYSIILEESVTGDLGNTQGISLGTGGGGGWASDPHLIFAYARFDYTKYSGTTSVNKTFAHARYNYEFAPWIWGEAFAQLQSDEFQRLDLRNLFGVGPRVRFFRATGNTPEKDANVKAPTQTFDMFVGTAYMFERDVITAQVGATGPENQNIQIWHRWSNYVTLQWQIDPRAIISTTMYVQPAFNKFSNVRLLDESILTFALTKLFAAGITATVRYDSEPP